MIGDQRGPSFLSFSAAGKGSNPPLYWQKHVFPRTLAHIAAAVGGIEPAGGACEEPSAGEASPSSALRPDRAPVTDAAQHDGGEEQHARTVDGAPSGTNKRSSASDSRSRATSVGGERNRRFGDRPNREPRGGSMPVLPSPRSRSPPARGGDDAGTGLGGLQTPATPPVPDALGAQERHGESRARGKCLVACPTGAEASVIVCLAALLAFFRDGSGAADESRDENKVGSGQREACGDNTVDDGGNIGGGVKHGRKDTEKGDGDEDKHHGGASPEGPFARCAFFAVGARASVTKVEVRSMLAAIQAYCPSAWPPRRLMKDVDKYFMTPGEHSWATLLNRLLAM